MTNVSKTVTLSAPLLPGDTLTLTVKAPVPVTPPVVITLPTGSALTSQPTPNTPAPALGQTITEGPVKVTCISTTQRHAYPLTNPWNSDGSRIMLNFTQVGAQILLGTPPYTLLATIQVPPFAFWSTTDPHTIYGAQGNALVKITDTGGPFQTVHDFGAPVNIGNYEGGVSNDGCVALHAGSTLYIWDVVNNREVSRMPLPGGIDGYQISRGGQHLVIRGGNTRVYPRDLSSSRELDPRANHGACCLIRGVDYYVGNNATAMVNGTLTAVGVNAFRLSDGQRTQLFDVNKTAFGDGHAAGYGPRPVLSNYDATRWPNTPGRDQMVGVNLDGTVVPFGFAHHLTPDLNDGPTYRHQPHAVGSADGKRVLFMGWDSVCCIAERTA